MRSTYIGLFAATATLLVVAGCGTTADQTSPGATVSTTIASATVSGHGTVLVAGSNGMTLYQFDKDLAGSGSSSCTGNCIDKWPPLTVASPSSAVAATGITGQVGTITRTDGKGIQVTYNGLPLYFYAGDHSPGDDKGDYPHWSSVSVVAGSAPTASASALPGY